MRKRKEESEIKEWRKNCGEKQERGINSEVEEKRCKDEGDKQQKGVRGMERKGGRGRKREKRE